jgi:hypothetical protein
MLGQMGHLRRGERRRMIVHSKNPEIKARGRRLDDVLKDVKFTIITHVLEIMYYYETKLTRIFHRP